MAWTRMFSKHGSSPGMSKTSTNCSSAGGPVGAEVKFAGNDSKSKMYEPKHKKKLIRVLTVIAYIFSVSLAAITLSLFYLFIYNPGKPGHGVGSSNGSANERFGGGHEDVMSLNNTYSVYEREEPRALPLETVEESRKWSASKLKRKPRSAKSKPNEPRLRSGKESFERAATLALT